jgi:Kef-type K+ transport system membrane component KefB
MHESLLEIGSLFQRPFQSPVLVFAFILLIILLAPIVLKRLNIPGIIGLILSGVLFGPFGLNLLEKNSAIELFSTIGLLYIMFIAGLELDIADFRRYRNRSILFGIFTFTFPILIGYPVCLYLLKMDINASLLTSSMFATHTLVSYPIVSKFGLSRNKAVSVTVGGTILTDSAVLILLAIILGNANGGLDNVFWIRMLVSLGFFILIMFYLVPTIIKRLFKKLSTEKHSQYILVLSVLFISALLAEFAGLEPIIGAFVAGLALNPLIPHSSALMNRIEFLGNSLFIPFFLISVGMLVDLSVILNGPVAIIIAITLTMVALLGKWLAAFAMQIAGGYTTSQRKLIFGLSSSHAAATLAVILVGFEAGILDENILNGTIILILITCMVASFVTERASRQVVLETSDGNTDKEFRTETFAEHILLPVANPVNLENMIDLANIIRNPKSVNPISLLSVVPNNEKAESNILSARKKIDELLKHASASDMRVNYVSCIDHNAASGISRTSKEILATHIMLGWPQKPDLFDLLAGDKTESIANNTNKFLLICHLPYNPEQFRRIILSCPSYAELEVGFSEWVLKIFVLSNDLNIPVVVFSNSNTFKALLKLSKIAFPGINISHELHNASDNSLFPDNYLKPEDFIVVITARRSSISYHPRFEYLPYRLSAEYQQNAKMLVYPGLDGRSHINQGYEEIDANPISLGLSWLKSIIKRKT